MLHYPPCASLALLGFTDEPATSLRQALARRARCLLVILAALIACPIVVKAQPFTFKGGDVVADAQVVVVFWGQQRPGMQDLMNRFYPRLLRSRYLSVLSEYSAAGKRLGRATFMGSVTILPNDNRIVDTVAIAREIDGHILNGTLPHPTPSTIYMVHPGVNVGVMMGSNIFGVPVGAHAGNGFCAYHFAAWTAVPTPAPTIAAFGPKIRIGVMPDPIRAGSNCGNAQTWPQNATTLASHELVETITNPDSVIVEMFPIIGANLQCGGVRVPVSAVTPVLTGTPISNGLSPWAWTSSKSQPCNPREVADDCSGERYETTGSPDGQFTVAQIFLNSQNRCVTPPGATAAPAPPLPAPPPLPTARQQCIAQCLEKQGDCLVNDTKPVQASCARAAAACTAKCRV